MRTATGPRVMVSHSKDVSLFSIATDARCVSACAAADSRWARGVHQLTDFRLVCRVRLVTWLSMPAAPTVLLGGG